MYMYVWRIIFSVLCVLLDQHVDLLGDLLITTILIDNFKKLLRADVKMSCGNDFRPLHVTASTNSMKQMCVSLCMKKVPTYYSRNIESTYSSVVGRVGIAVSSL